MVFNKLFQHPPEAVVSVDWTDIADGTGKQILYCYVTETDSGLDYHLTTEDTMYSTKIETNVSAGTTSFTKVIDLDFDLSAFNRHQVLKGVANVQFTVVAEHNTGAGSISAYGIARVKKNDVTIASAQSPTVSSSSGFSKELMNIPITIPETPFASGDILRLTIEVWGLAPATIAGEVAIGHDPRNRDGTIIIPSTDDPDTITQIIFIAPFKIVDL